MKRLFLTVLLLWSAITNAQPLLRNSITTNTLGTNLVWNPAGSTLNISGIGPALVLYNTAGGVNNRQYYLSSTANRFQLNWASDNNASSLTLGESDTNGNFELHGYLALSAKTNRLTIANDTLLLDGVAVGSSTTTNIYNNVTVTNLTVIQTNIFNVSKGGHLTVSNSLSILTIKTNLLATDGNGLVTNANYGTGITWDPSTRTISSSGSAGSTNYRSAVITLTMTGTNVDASQIDWLKTNVCYRLTLTNNAFFGDGVCINVPDTNSFQWLQLNLVQDSTGARTATFTNSIFAGVNGTFALTTNANAWDSLTLLNSAQTNGNIAVLPSNFLHR